MKCPYCGAEVAEGELFCGECGRPIEMKRKKSLLKKYLRIPSIRQVFYIAIGLFILTAVLADLGFIKFEPQTGETNNTSNGVTTPGVTPVVLSLNASVETIKAPAAAIEGRPFEVAWRVRSPIEATINHTAVHYGPVSQHPPLGLTSYLYISDILSGSVPADYSTQITIKHAGDYPGGILYFRTHAIIEGVSYWSEEKTITVQTISNNPIISEIFYPTSVKGDTNFNIQWAIFGGTPGIIKQTSIFWGFRKNNYPRTSTLQTGYTPAGFTAEITPPSGGVIFFRVHALVDNRELFSQEYEITID